MWVYTERMSEECGYQGTIVMSVTMVIKKNIFGRLDIWNVKMMLIGSRIYNDGGGWNETERISEEDLLGWFCKGYESRGNYSARSNDV